MNSEPMPDALAATAPLDAAADTAAAPDLDAFLAGVERPALRLARLRLGSREDGLDAVQDAMLRLATRYADKPAAEWKPLFWSILRRRIIDLQRRRAVRAIVQRWRDRAGGADAPALEERLADPQPGPLDALLGAEARNRLDAALRTLPPRQFEAFTLRVLQELDGATTARVMGCSEGSVKTHLSRARAALRRHLEEGT